MPKYLTFLPILLLTLGTIAPIAIAKPQPGTKIDRSTAPTPKYTGVVKQVDDIAQQITVRIEDKEENGSGVIIAKERNTYLVVTAAHVVKNKEGYSIITPTQERIKVRAEQVTILNKDLDVALVKFTSSQNYRVAELANYQFKNRDWVFVSGFPGNDTTHRRSLSIGIVQDKDNTEFSVQDKMSLSNGNNLIYTNLSLPGMSGGGVLDREGRLVGINTGAENKEIINQDNYQREQINFGYALGISVSTILGAFTQGQISTAQLKVRNLQPSQLVENDSMAIRDNLLSTLSLPSQTSTAKEWLDYGNLLWRSRQNNKSVISFDRVIVLLKRGGSNSDKEQLKLAYFGKGLSLASENQQKEAVAAFGAAIAIDPQFIQAWRYHGISLKKLQQYNEALVSYQKAIKLDPRTFVFFVEQGDIFVELKRYQEAIGSYSSAIKIQPNHPWAYNNRGISYKDLKQYSQAIADFDQAIKINPQSEQSYSNRGVTYTALKQYPQAIADFDQAIKINPQSEQSYNNRGATYSTLKQYSQAIADFDQAIKINPQSQQAYYNRGNTYGLLEQYPQAIADYTQAIKINPQSEQSYYSRGISYNNLKQYHQAIADYTQAIKINPQFEKIYISRGVAYYDLAQYPQAIADFDQVITINPQFEKAYYVYYLRGLAYKALKQYPQAIADFDQVIKINPQYAEVYYSRGVIYGSLEQNPQAIADYDRAIKINPQYAEAYYIRGLMYGLLKQYRKSKTDLEQAANLYQQQDNQSGYQTVMKLLQKI